MEHFSFLSYCWADKDSSFVEEIDTVFLRNGVQLKRDIRDTDYKDSLKEFMQKTKTSDAVIMVISDSYLRSRNCMYEVLEVYKDDNYKKKIFPIILPGTNIYKTEDQIELYEYWKNKYEELEQRTKSISIRDVGGLDEELRVYDNIKGSINQFISLLRDLKVPPYHELKSNNFQDIIENLPFEIQYYFEPYSILNIDQSNHLLDQTYDAIKLLHFGIDFYPLHLLVKQYPFSMESKTASYYDFYTLHTNNEDLYLLFEQISKEEINDEEICKIKNYKEKIDAIMKQLVGNRILYIEHQNKQERITLRLIEKNNQDDIQYLYESYSFTKCYNQLKTQSDNLNELLKYAYTAYRMCEYTLSAEYLLKAHNLALLKNAKAAILICLSNLEILKDHLLYWVRDQERGLQLIEEIKKLDIKKHIEELNSTELIDYVSWIENNLFYHNSNEKIHNTLNNIISHYYSQLKGGRSENSLIENLVNIFELFIFFLGKSYIFFEHFSNFDNFSARFIEGVLASNAISKNGGSRLLELNDFHAINIIDCAKNDDIIKYVNRYKLSCIKYRSKNPSLLKEVIDNFLTSSEEISKNKDFYIFNNSFWRRYSQIFVNILTFLSYSDIENSYINSFSKRLITFLENENIISIQDLRYVANFFNKVAQRIETTILYRFLSLSFTNKKYHDRSLNILNSISNGFKRKNKQIEITPSQFQQINGFLHKYFDDPSEGGVIIPHFLGQVLMNFKFTAK